MPKFMKETDGGVECGDSLRTAAQLSEVMKIELEGPGRVSDLAAIDIIFHGLNDCKCHGFRTVVIFQLDGVRAPDRRYEQCAGGLGTTGKAEGATQLQAPLIIEMNLRESRPGAYPFRQSLELTSGEGSSPAVPDAWLEVCFLNRIGEYTGRHQAAQP